MTATADAATTDGHHVARHADCSTALNTLFLSVGS
jgi:hypothetical protein